MRIVVTPADPAADLPPFRATATSLNRHGAMITCDHELKLASQILLTNRLEQTEIARVVAKVGHGKTFKKYGVEFVHASAGASFWGITFQNEVSGETTRRA